MVPHYRVHLGYGDGLSSISLFEARMQAPADFTPPYQADRQGRLWVLTGYREGCRLTLVGEIGRDDLARMLTSVGVSRAASRTQEAGGGP
jgi:negative regulator of sigma E activity